MVYAAEQRTILSPLSVNRNNPRYFTDDSGKAIYLAGSHTWSNLKDMGDTYPPYPSDFQAYLDFLISHNHNFIRLWTWELAKYQYPKGQIQYAAPFPWKRTGPGIALDGGQKFDLAQWDDEYFDRLRSRVAAAGNRGIYVSIMLFEGHGIQSSSAPLCWEGHPFHPKNNTNGINGDPNGDGRGNEIHTLDPAVMAVTELQKAYVKKVIDTVNDLDNVLYEICNECGSESREWQYKMITFIKKYEAGKPKHHPVGMTSYLEPLNTDLFDSPADWISPGWMIWGNDLYQINPPAADGSKVIISDTDHLWGMGGDREWVWKSFTRGLHTIYMDDPAKASHQDASGKKWPSDDARRAMGHARIFADRMNLNKMVPRNDLASTMYCLANPGHEYLIYSPKASLWSSMAKTAVTVDLEAGEYMYEWFNPGNGMITAGVPFTSKRGQRSFRQPFRGDAVLYIYKA